MQKTKLTKWRSSFLCFVLIAAVALFVTGCKDNKTPANHENNPQQITAPTILGEGAVTFNFSVIGKDGKETDFVINTDQKTVCDALTEHDLIDGDMGPYGLYVKTVNGETLDFDKDGKYWAFYIDEEYATSGIENTDVTPGATYTFRAE